MAKNKKSTVIISFFLLTLIPLHACSSFKQPSHPVNYYTLEYPVPEMISPSTLPFVIRVENFQISPAYNTDNIIYREMPFNRNAYTYHKWRANPGDLVTYFLTRDLNESSVVTSVVSLKSRLIATHILEGTVEDFYESDEKDGWKAILSLRIALIKNNEPDVSKRIVFQKKYSETAPLSQKNPKALAAAMSQNMSRISKQVIDDVYSYLSREMKGE